MKELCYIKKEQRLWTVYFCATMPDTINLGWCLSGKMGFYQYNSYQNAKRQLDNLKQDYIIMGIVK